MFSTINMHDDYRHYTIRSCKVSLLQVECESEKQTIAEVEAVNYYLGNVPTNIYSAIAAWQWAYNHNLNASEIGIIIQNNS